jgi:putative ubiquitin-RnfH superfamily antitoxin RatB of RatAB toxin-antitoxin module
MERIGWTHRVKNEVLHRVKERNILQTIKIRKANCIDNILRSSCLLKQVTERKIEGRIDVTGRRGKMRKQLPD